MIITCEACNTSFNLDDKMLKPTGSKVRCSVCANVFTAFPQQEPAPEPVRRLRVGVCTGNRRTSEADLAVATPVMRNFELDAPKKIPTSGLMATRTLI